MLNNTYDFEIERRLIRPINKLLASESTQKRRTNTKVSTHQQRNVLPSNEIIFSFLSSVRALKVMKSALVCARRCTDNAKSEKGAAERKEWKSNNVASRNVATK